MHDVTAEANASTAITQKIQNMLSRAGNLGLIVFLVNDSDAGLYSLIKRLCDQQMGIANIYHVCKDQRPRRKDTWNQFYGPSRDWNLMGNLAMKANLKIGLTGANQILAEKLPYLDNETMLMGMDVVCNLRHLGLADH
jgi:hypothetical protein